MDKQRAIQLIGDTFNYPFDEGRFRNFAVNLLNNVDETKGFDYLSGTYIRHSFKNHISKYRRLGTYTDPNGEKIDVLVVQVKNDWALERSRTMLRNFTADYLKNRDEKDAALVAYYTNNPDDWRFSYIRMEYKRVQTESGKFKIKEDITPAKRYSFLVGKNEPNHTAQAQLVGILADDRNNPTLSSLESAFSVDVVTKQFYKDYRTQFEKLWNELNDIVAQDPKIAEEFETKTIDAANFAKKLMGQIVFLYFLQKKGWLGVGKDENGNYKAWGTGPKNFLRRLFDKEFTDYGNFFNEVLEPLFYEALATERPNDVYSRFNCKIPFLNGGLFEPINDYNWEETDICIDNDLIAEVFNTFDQYNFTVREDEPLEKEVAVDPEMLGKVFENLLPENLRKGKGAYYTPRTIVHYMCQESLINYLDTTINSPLERGGCEADGVLNPSTHYTDESEAEGVFHKYKQLPYNPKLKERAKELRKAGVLSEVLFWNQVKGKQFLALDFHRQKIIGNYIVDFYCPALNLVVEIDGESHDEKYEYDKKRDEYLNSLGLQVLHFSDIDIKKNLTGVMDSLRAFCNTPPDKSGTPLKEGKNTPSLREAPLKEGNSVPKEDIETLIREGDIILELETAIVEEGKKYKSVLMDSIKDNAQALDNALANIKVCDPAIGSGAFPVGMLNEIVKARQVLEIYLNKKRGVYELKRHCIQNSLYGVDIDPGAIEIAKLRLWLSLVVDEDDYENIQPLPNLDYKIMQGNSLIEEFHGISLDIEKKDQQQEDLFAGGSDLDALIADLHLKQANFFNAEHPREKKKKREAVEAAIFNIFHHELQKKKSIAPQEAQEIENDLREMTHGNKTRNFFPWKLYFADVFREKGGFDVIIGNPPYVRHERIKEQKQAFEQHHSRVYQGTADLYVYFYHQGIKILHPNGFLTLITGNKFMRAGYGKKLRQFLAKETTPKTLIDFGDLPVFDATAYPCIVITQKAPAPGDNTLVVLTVETAPQIEQITTVMVQQAWSMPQQKALTSDGWRLEPTEVVALLEKLKKAGTPLGEYVNGRFYRGVLTGYNEAFVIDRATRDRLIAEHPSSAEIIKPFLRGRDVKRWCIDSQDLWLIFTRRGIKIDEYPAIKHYLLPFKERLTPKPKNWKGKWFGRKAGSYQWYEIQDNIAYWQEFEQPKIAYPNICKRNEFAWDEKHFYTNQKAFIIPNSSKYLLGVLNSSVVMWLFDKMLAKLQNGFYEPSAIFMEKFPIPKLPTLNPIDTLVTRILEAKKTNPVADVSTLEAEIDRLVYELYRLTEEEIKIVEESIS